MRANTFHFTVLKATKRAFYYSKMEGYNFEIISKIISKMLPRMGSGILRRRAGRPGPAIIRTYPMAGNFSHPLHPRTHTLTSD